ncbi:type IV pili twitching motility protein PilT [candidate division WOR-3 bacterium RBG_13_43_14]|uniref:Type IV pili twitching motility protein PilT n=1 Tax=candidate division WOR-3 bacterium RBG_13_43_14 TaxID=1802590 RepID=A0A1F4U4Y4_UNCW3|nr:MAG: type IV pili twitching motility protein PilT [candidate division WOR-3 bacterium RBG_13_43_14]
MIKITELLKAQIQYHASDLILKVNSPPIMRIDGELKNIDLPAITQVDLESGIVEILSKIQIAEYRKNYEIDFSYETPDGFRFRVNLFRQKGNMGGVARLIPRMIPSIDIIGLPNALKEMAMRPRGLIVVTGPSGCGKSTTQAAVIDYRNENDTCHIVTVEDPVEFIHENKKALVTQREVGHDTHSFANALKFVLRQDPDVILIGEMRDLETIKLAITAAETGHLVVTTLHTSEAVTTIDRIVDVFPPHQQNQIRMQISLNLLGIVSQNLLKRADGKGRIAAYEILIAIPAVRNLIREGKTYQISSILQTSQQLGMISFDACLANMVRKKLINREEAELKALNPDTFHREMEQIAGNL